MRFQAAAPAAARLARNDPVPGSVTQSSRGNVDNVTLDQIDATARYQGQVLHVRATAADGREIDSDGGLSPERTDFPGGAILFYPDGPVGAVAYGVDRSWTTVSLSSGDPDDDDRPIGSQVVDLGMFITDIENARDTDFLIAGIWLSGTFDAFDSSDPAGVTIVTFADGSSPFNGNLEALTGSATYNGRVRAVSTATGDPEIFPIGPHGGDVVLTADFGVGTISGAIDFDGFELLGWGDSLTLDTADIGSGNAGFFNGTAAIAEFLGQSYTGRWGGQFYGTGAGPTGHPGSAAGTFGVTTGDGSQSIVGAYGAHR